MEGEVKQMDRLLTINGKNYKAAEFDVNFMCEMEDNGIQIEDIDKNMFKTINVVYVVFQLKRFSILSLSLVTIMNMK